MNKTEQLEKLFERWQQKQINEPDDSLSKTKVNCDYINKAHFCKDGILCENEYNAEKLRVLFIANEPNMESDKSSVLLSSQTEQFEEFYKNNKDSWGGKLRHRICKILYPAVKDTSIESNAFPIANGNINAHKIAFMNLNKRGGEKNIKDDHLINYCEYYKNEIIEEISIIEPDLIVWLGKNSFYSCADILFDFDKRINDTCGFVMINNKRISVICTFHPSYCFNISNEIRVNDIREKYQLLVNNYLTSDN